MSVLECDRRECPNIMCDRYSIAHRAYLCEECFEELADRERHISIESFLETPKMPKDTSIRDYYDNIFRHRDKDYDT